MTTERKSPNIIAKALQAVGPLDGLDPKLRATFLPGKGFEIMKNPRPGDGIAKHFESGQTFKDFVAGKWNRPEPGRSKIALLPIESVPGWEVWPSMEALAAFTLAFFRLETQILPALILRGIPVTSRINQHTGKIQLLTGDLLNLLSRRIPLDAFCLLGISMDDLYPDPAWNFVFGEATLRGRTAVYSFARYDPAFYESARIKESPKLLLKRCCKVLAHETCHMFGIKHCIYFRCLMNGSNSLSESDRRPINLCPVCLRKLHRSIGFGISERYRSLADFYESQGFQEEYLWIQSLLKS